MLIRSAYHTMNHQYQKKRNSSNKTIRIKFHLILVLLLLLQDVFKRRTLQREDLQDFSPRRRRGLTLVGWLPNRRIFSPINVRGERDFYRWDVWSEQRSLPLGSAVLGMSSGVWASTNIKRDHCNWGQSWHQPVVVNTRPLVDYATCAAPSLDFYLSLCLTFCLCTPGHGTDNGTPTPRIEAIAFGRSLTSSTS